MLGPRFEGATTYAAQAHAGQLRKGTETPYLAHLLGVAALVLEDGGDEDEAIAALLHDAVEDAGGSARLADIRRRFGDRVAEIVASCSDSIDGERTAENWRERKDDYLEHLESLTDTGVLRVSLADKLHNVRAILRDLESWRGKRSAFWARFNTGRKEQLWYYDQLVGVFRAKHAGPMARELRRTTKRLHKIAG